MFCFQEVSHKLCETLSMVANMGVIHTEYVLVDANGSVGKTDKHPANGGEGRMAEEMYLDAATNGVLAQDSAAVRDSDSSAASMSLTLLGMEGLDRDNNSSAHAQVDGGLKENGGAVNEEERRTATNKKKLSVSEELLQPTLQALAVLSNVSLKWLLWCH